MFQRVCEIYFRQVMKEYPIVTALTVPVKITKTIVTMGIYNYLAYQTKTHLYLVVVCISTDTNYIVKQNTYSMIPHPN